MVSKKNSILYRNALVSDAPKIKTLLDIYASQRKLLPRSLQYIIENIRNFKVAFNEHQEIIGCCAASISQSDLAEIKSLAVHPDYHQKGIASTLVKESMDDVRKMGVNKFFCLTYVPDFFNKIGFKLIDKNELPHKIWTECIHCPFFPDCNENAMIFND